ncbi:hypothetical protein [Bacillus sp. UMB0893]|uniref:hypothetical protein n=1 Tax=Bacillus sp. UMB0893 TaxID=2066053 RepID=UPI000C785C74|nr:hypothetical protein [Bacillus sp. UMB0893]PLR66145.1 hypothetical protein CYJ36_18695 [Bacillus sp. UMB0893]QNG58344.1 hypothetical protein H4O14_10735 [Bacillus sp. PAMC26568]
MSQNYYNLCCQYHGKVVRISDRFGNQHVGRIMNVTRNKVYIQPFGGRRRGGYGLGFYGGGYGYGYGYGGYGIGLAFITGVVLGGLLFW